MLFRWKRKRLDCSLETRQVIYETCFDRIFRIALAITRNSRTAEDVAQETFTLAFEKGHQLRDPSKVGAWLSSIAINCARNSFNSQKRIVLMEPDNALLTRKGSFKEDERLERVETAQVLAKALRALPPEFLEVVILRYYSDLSVDEMAKLLNLPAGTVKSRLSRARAKLLAALRDQEEPGVKGGIINASR